MTERLNIIADIESPDNHYDEADLRLWKMVAGLMNEKVENIYLDIDVPLPEEAKRIAYLQLVCEDGLSIEAGGKINVMRETAGVLIADIHWHEGTYYVTIFDPITKAPTMAVYAEA